MMKDYKNYKTALESMGWRRIGIFSIDYCEWIEEWVKPAEAGSSYKYDWMRLKIEIAPTDSDRPITESMGPPL